MSGLNELNYEEIGKRIRETRKALNLTQEAASERCDITSSYYGNLERGDKKMSVETLARISQGLHVSVDYLLFGGNLEQKDDLLLVVEELRRNADDRQYEKYRMLYPALKPVFKEWNS